MDSQTRPCVLNESHIENNSCAGNGEKVTNCEGSLICSDWKIKGYCLKTTCKKNHYEIDNEIAFDLPVALSTCIESCSRSSRNCQTDTTLPLEKSLPCVEASHSSGNLQPKDTPLPESVLCETWRTKGYCTNPCCKEHFGSEQITPVTQDNRLNNNPLITGVTSNCVITEESCQSEACVQRGSSEDLNGSRNNTCVETSCSDCSSYPLKGYCTNTCCKEHFDSEQITPVTQNNRLNNDPLITGVTSNCAITEESCQSEACVQRGRSEDLNGSRNNSCVDTSSSDCSSYSLKGYCIESECRIHNQTVKDVPSHTPDISSTEDNSTSNSDNMVVVIQNFGDPIAQVFNSTDSGSVSRTFSQTNGFCNSEDKCDAWETKGYCMDPACPKEHTDTNIDVDLYFDVSRLNHSASFTPNEVVDDSSSSDSDDPETGDFIPDDEKNICRYFSEYGSCWKTYCRFSHVPTVENKVTNEQVQGYVDCFNELCLPGYGEMVTLFVTSVISPTSFYAHLPSVYYQQFDLGELETLKSLTLALNADNNVQNYESLGVLPSDGELLLGQCSDSCWYRVRVTDIEFTKASVFLVDYGLYKNLKLNRLRNIPPKFLHLPFQAVHCKLRGIYQQDGTSAKEGIKKLENCILNRTVTATVKFTCPNNDLIEVVAHVNGESVNDYMVTTGLVDSQP